MAFKRVAIVQPWLPEYRKAFYELLQTEARAAGIVVDIFVGETPPEWRARGDTLTLSSVATLPTKRIRIGRRHLLYKSPKLIASGDYDLVVLEFAVRNLESYLLLMRLGRKRIAFWGHGKTYTKDIPAIQERLKFWLVKRGKWFLSYTQGGANAVIEQGFPAEYTTVLNNSIDTKELREQLTDVSDQSLRIFADVHGLLGHTALYLGALDTYKRIRMLLDAAERAHELDPSFRLLIAGNGDDRPMVEGFCKAHPWAVYIGAVTGREKALALRASQAIAIPGAIGLLALDSLVSGVPIVTTSFAHHGPEFEYLSPGDTVEVSPDDPDAFATALVRFLYDSDKRHRMAERCIAVSQQYSTEQMVSRFVIGLQGALAVPGGS